MKVNNKILSHIQDDLSKEIYLNRIDYNNRKYESIKKIVSTVIGGKELVDFMNKYKDNLYIFGAGVLGTEFVRTWNPCYSFCGIIDNNKTKQGKKINGIPVIGLEEIAIKDKAAIIIVNKFSYNEIEKQLQKEKINFKRIFNFGRYFKKLNSNQYFDLKELDKSQKERFVDCGALDGMTSINMYKWYRENVEKMWIFEPDKISAERCRKNLSKIDFKNYKVVEKAVYSSKTQLFFNSTSNGMASISPQGNVIVDTISLDEALREDDPSFIKMDIEGAEFEALIGAKRIIENSTPKLAISVYHKPEDIEEIPLLLLEYNPEYNFYLRHYSLTKNETVLYAL